MEKARICPYCGHNRFSVIVHIAQEWEVDENGNFLNVLQDCTDVDTSPAEAEIWQCMSCGGEHSERSIYLSETEKQDAASLDEIIARYDANPDEDITSKDGRWDIIPAFDGSGSMIQLNGVNQGRITPLIDKENGTVISKLGSFSRMKCSDRMGDIIWGRRTKYLRNIGFFSKEAE